MNRKRNQQHKTSALPQNRQPEEFTAIWQEYYPKLMLFVAPFFKTQRSDIEDAVQEILLKVYKTLKHYNPRYRFSTWLYRIARNHCLDKSRQAARQLKRQQAIIPNMGQTDFFYNPEKLAMDAELKQKVRMLLGQLKETDRQICFLYHYEELNYKEISRIMKIPVGTIKYRMHEIRGIIKYRMEDYYAEIHT